MKTIKEIRSAFVDGENYRHIDVWFTDNEDENGRTVAIFCEDTGKHYYIDKIYSWDDGVKTTLKILKQNWDVANANSDMDTQNVQEWHYLMGDIQISSKSITALKQLSHMISEMNCGVEFPNQITDTLFAIDCDYQAYHGLDQNNWELVNGEG